jgi:hypothetical protein
VIVVIKGQTIEYGASLRSVLWHLYDIHKTMLRILLIINY